MHFAPKGGIGFPDHFGLRCKNKKAFKKRALDVLNEMRDDCCTGAPMTKELAVSVPSSCPPDQACCPISSTSAGARSTTTTTTTMHVAPRTTATVTSAPPSPPRPSTLTIEDVRDLLDQQRKEILREIEDLLQGDSRSTHEETVGQSAVDDITEDARKNHVSLNGTLQNVLARLSTVPDAVRQRLVKHVREEHGDGWAEVATYVTGTSLGLLIAVTAALSYAAWKNRSMLRELTTVRKELTQTQKEALRLIQDKLEEIIVQTQRAPRQHQQPPPADGNNNNKMTHQQASKVLQSMAIGKAVNPPRIPPRTIKTEPKVEPIDEDEETIFQDGAMAMSLLLKKEEEDGTDV